MPTASDVISAVTADAAKYGVPTDLALNVAHAESAFDPNIHDSSAGAIGPMQLMAPTASDLGVDPHDWRQNVDGGVRYLSQQLSQFHGDPALAAAAYNAGPGAVQRFGGVPPYPETQAYVAKVTGTAPTFGTLPKQSDLASAFQASQGAAAAPTGASEPAGAAPASTALAGAETTVPGGSTTVFTPGGVARTITPKPDGTAVDTSGGVYKPNPQYPGEWLDASGQSYAAVNALPAQSDLATAFQAAQQPTPSQWQTVDGKPALPTSFDRFGNGIDATGNILEKAGPTPDQFAGLNASGNATAQPYSPMDFTSALGRHFADAISGGTANKGEAAIAAMIAAARGQPMGPAYTSELNRQNAMSLNSGIDQPVAARIGGATGIAVQAVALPEMKAGSLITRAGQGALVGAGLSGLNAFGQARGSLPQEIAQVAPAVMSGATIGALSGGMAGPSAESTPTNLGAYERMGVDPTLAVNGGRSAQQIAAGLKGTPIIGSPLARAAATTSEQLDNAALTTAAKAATPNAFGVRPPPTLSPAQNAFSAGGALQRGAQEGVDTMKSTANYLYGKTAALDASTQAIPATNTQQAIDGFFAKYPTIPDWLAKRAPEIAQLRQTLASAPNGLTFGELRGLRSEIGGMTQDMTVNSTDQANLKQLYGALTDDMRAGARQIGGPQAQADLARADNFYSGMQTRIQDTLDKTFNAPSQEAAFQQVVTAAQTGARADLSRLQLLKRSVPPAAWGDVASGVIGTMGRDANGAFSPSAFATQYSKFTPEAKAALFGRGGLSLDMDALGQIAGDQQAASKFYNNSNTGHLIVGAGAAEEMGRAVMEGRYGHAAVMGALGGMGYGASKLLASPGFGRMLLRFGSGPSWDAGLMAYAKVNPQLAPLINTFRTRLANVPIAIGAQNQTGAQPDQPPTQGQMPSPSESAPPVPAS